MHDAVGEDRPTTLQSVAEEVNCSKFKLVIDSSSRELRSVWLLQLHCHCFIPPVPAVPIPSLANFCGLRIEEILEDEPRLWHRVRGGYSCSFITF
jgi:hypothetical protein